MKTERKAGRPAGSKNIVTREIRERFKELIENNLTTFQNDLDSLEPFERLKLIMQMTKFVLPTLKAIEERPNEEETVINISFYDSDTNEKKTKELKDFKITDTYKPKVSTPN